MEPPAAIKLPGFGLPVDFLPEAEHRFPVLVGNSKIDFKANTLTIRELCMLQFIEEITNKPDWWVKVHNAEIAARWKAEALEMNWAAFLKYADFTPAMADACIQELKLKADLYQKTSLVPVFDYTAAVIKSDDLIPEHLWQALRQGVKLLEDVPEDEKDWHPGSDGKVLDLVHPSLWPLVYGKSRILPDRRIGLSDALDNCGMGDVIPEPAPPRGRNRHCTSTKFQWLPCDVSVERGRVKIESYINNLHPVKHASLYPVIERFIEKALPAWDLLYRWPGEFETQRLTTDSVSVRCRTRRTCAKSHHACEPKARPTRDDEPRRCAYEDPYSDSEVSESEEEIDDGDDEDEEEEEEEDEDEDDDDDDDSQDEGNRNQRTESEGLPNPSQLLVQMGPPKQDEPESEYETEQYDSAEERDNAAKEYTKDEEEDEDDEDEEDEERDPNHVSENEVKRRDWRWFYKTHPVNAPEPSSTEPRLKLSASDVKTTDFLRPKQPQAQGDPPSRRRLQVIVKLANIHLTPERPSYDGGSWHVEGQLNEHICATALFYHDSDNITPSRLDLRTQANREGLDESGRLRYEQYDWRTIQRTFAIGWPGGGSTAQRAGGVLTRDRRALFLPNVLQHRVAPFRLADPARRGHRKILALFLVDPAVPVVSTANVPPQQKHWWLGRLGLDGGRGCRLPPELTAMMLRNVEFPMDWEAAVALRRELMEERTARESQTADRMGRVEWNFCEH
ncbi:Armadillo-like helical [Metarhizium guizhouense ARSEF 977]|uniref:Armadillo-like helical n=1 Tax=Metarhizium guizhouense (strain ARSEF 977) TaxID=1276136 RepID=A0A0B4GYI2_METGA|nr:Armadillo-like helical [Metarhizium guizhouense ARSEF 977]